MPPMKDDVYFALARKWRPQQFDDVVGQEHITKTLKNAVSSGRVHHALLFIGSRGVGKTTTARILAKALNCLSSDKPTSYPCDKCSNCIEISRGNHLDVQEIDGASNNSVDNIREIREAVRLAPANARYKVYIIDEVHQLSASAFNALLKTLEEPPPHAIFILATTEAHKIPATIISRCQRFDFRRVSTPNIVQLLEKIVEAENRKATKEALYAIARVSDGAVRDAESILDQLMTYCDDEITYKDVQDVLGLIEFEKIAEFVVAVRDRDLVKVLKIIDDLAVSGKDLFQFVDEVIRFFRNILVYKSTKRSDVLYLPQEDVERIKAVSEGFTTVQLIRLIEQLALISQNFNSQISQRTVLESFFVRYCKVGVEISLEQLFEKLIRLEDYLKERVSNSSMYSHSYSNDIDTTEDSSVKKNFEGTLGNKSHHKPIIETPRDSSMERVRLENEVYSASIEEGDIVGSSLWERIFSLLCEESASVAVNFSKVRSVEYDEANQVLVLNASEAGKDVSNALKDNACVEMLKKICFKLGYKILKFRLNTEGDESGKIKKNSSDLNDVRNNDLNETSLPSHLVEVLEKVQGKVVGIIDTKDEYLEEFSAGEEEYQESQEEYD
ncbi:MAG: DNA polymerase III subunit gamma/tau [Candidatus Hydrogenedentes bacterium]|nr:DNA polymerase III subunit gamma/tau [Candidatus Hydrogenedentota bacterium]